MIGVLLTSEVDSVIQQGRQVVEQGKPAIKRKFGLSTALSVATLLGPVAAQAQLDDFQSMDDPAVAEESFKGVAELGYNKISGNSNSESLNAGTSLTWFDAPWSYNLQLSAKSASDDDETSAEEYIVQGRTRYNLSAVNYLFGLARWDKERFSGYDSQSTLIAGYGRQILTGPPHSLALEVGPGVRHDEYEDDGSDNLGLLYTGLDYAWQFSQNSRFSQTLATEASRENFIARSQTALTVAMNDTLSLKIAYEVDFNDSPPPEASSQTDTTTGVSIVYNL